MTASDVNARGTAGKGGAAGYEAGFGATDLWLFLMTLIWGVNYAVIKYALEDFIPINFTAMRLAIATVVMVAVVKLSGRDLKIDRKDLPQIIAIGVLANVLYQALFINGMKLSRAGNASLILATAPLFTALIGRLRRTESFSAGGVMGLLMARRVLLEMDYYWSGPYAGLRIQCRRRAWCTGTAP
jgi:drug/metabolite transporter (DMT)-like permease